jgi:hypothetical protein
MQFTGAAALNAVRQTVIVGQTARLPCTASPPLLDVHWTFTATDSSEDHVLYSQGTITDGYKQQGRFSVDRTIEGEHTLVMKDFQTDDAGVYVCTCIYQDGSMKETNVHVAVQVQTGMHEDCIALLNLMFESVFSI